MASDPVPNIRFNVAKTIEIMYKKVNNTNKMKCKEVLKKIENDDSDFDCKFYAQKALKAIGE
jgi:serine/threonine-protein phosphatase 2A regulatory subunit A